jgi:flagellar hook-length control protein FliK
MTSVDMGFEAALNLGLPPAAAGKSGGLEAPVNSTAMPRAGQAEHAGTACFRTALRAAAEKDKGGAAASASPPEASASRISNDNDTAPEADSLECVDADNETKSAEPSAEKPGAEELVSACCQWVEAIPAISPTEDPACRAAEGTNDDAGPPAAAAIPQETIELLDLLRRLKESLAGDSADAAALLRQIGERFGQCQASADGSTNRPAGGIPEDVLSRLRDALSAAAAELSSLESSVSDEADPAAQTPGVVSGSEDAAMTGTEAPGIRRTIEASDILPAVRRVLAQFKEVAGAAQNHPATAAVEGEAPTAPAEAADGFTASPGTADGAAGNASVLKTVPYTENPRNGAAPEFLRQAGAEVERSGAPAETRQESSAESGDYRQSSDDGLYSKLQATPSPATDAGEASPDGLALTARDTPASTVAERGLEKTADSQTVSRDKEAMTGTGRAGIFDQIVQRAAVQLRNDQGEINIDLKPDFLGRVRMQILTENQQVTVRIVTELAAVRDMIESGLNQLKSELQSQGLQVERLEVAVADDHRQRGWQQAHTAPAWKTAAAGGASAMERSDVEERSSALYYRPRSGGTASIDMFV